MNSGGTAAPAVDVDDAAGAALVDVDVHPGALGEYSGGFPEGLLFQSDEEAGAVCDGGQSSHVEVQREVDSGAQPKGLPLSRSWVLWALLVSSDVLYQTVAAG